MQVGIVVLDFDAALALRLDDIRGFAGDHIEQAVFYPEDDDFLIDRETTVSHYEVPVTA